MILLKSTAVPKYSHLERKSRTTTKISVTYKAYNDSKRNKMVNQMITIVIVDDHKIVRQGIRSLLETETDLRVVGEAANGVGRVLPVEEYDAAETALRVKYGAQYDQVTANSDRATRVFWEVKPA